MRWIKYLGGFRKKERTALKTATEELDAAYERAQAHERAHTPFMHKVFGDIKTAFERADNRAASERDDRAIDDVKKQMLDVIEDELFGTMLRRPLLWEKNLRFVRAMRSVATEEGALESMDDVVAFYSAFSSELFQVPDAVEYYENSGELLEVLQALEENDYVTESTPLMLGFSIHSTQHRLHRLYDYDMSRRTEVRGQKEDENSGSLIPLEIRMSFSGFYEEVTEEDIRSDTRLVHSAF